MSTPTPTKDHDLDPDIGPESDTEQSMAAMLGFSSFGQNRPSKKRRFNTHADDAITSNDSQTSPNLFAGPLPTTTGANSLPVHPRYDSRQPPPQPADLATLDVKVDSSGKIIFPRDTDIETVKAYIASKSPGGVLPADFDPYNLDDQSWEIEGETEPAIDVPPGRWGRANTPPFPGDTPSAQPQWYDNYYDRNSNENPWERLERERGIAAVGLWPEAGGRGAVVPGGR